MKNKPIVSGIIAIASPIPLIIFTALWCWIWTFAIGMGLFHYDNIPNWIWPVALLPLFISPILGVLGIIHGIIKRKEKSAWLGITLSIMGLLENALLIYGMAFLGSRF